MSTLKRIADVAGCSVSTVSRALNNCHDVSIKTRKRILQIAKDLGYFQRKKHIKLENRRKNEFNIAIICPEIESTYYSIMIACLTKELAKHNCRTLIYNYAFDKYELDRLFDMCRDANNIDAIYSLERLKVVNNRDEIPIVCGGENDMYSSVTFDFSKSVFECLEWLEKNEKTKLFFVGEEKTRARERTVIRQAKNFPNISVKTYISNERFENAGRDAAMFLLNKEELPTAIICAYDEIALGLIECLTKADIKVPEQISVIGINDIPCSAHCYGGLTTIGFDFDKICPTIVNDIIDNIKNATNKIYKYKIPNRFIIRNT